MSDGRFWTTSRRSPEIPRRRDSMQDALSASAKRLPPDTRSALLLTERYLRALARGDRSAADACLSSSFLLHEGRGRNEHLDHELGEFARLGELYGAGSGMRVLDRGRARADGCFGFLAVAQDGSLIYEDALPIAEDGLFGGDGSAFETVTKLHLKISMESMESMDSMYSMHSMDDVGREFGRELAAVEIRRGLAVRRGARPADAALVRSPRCSDQAFLSVSPDPDYSSLIFALDEDDGRTIDAEILLYSTPSKLREAKRLTLRGIDHPFFEAAAFPLVRGRAVEVPKTRSRPWSLDVAWEGGGRQILHPDAGTFEFEGVVTRAILTDAVDNDWETVA